MKKLDWFVIRAFIGPFILTTAVVVFILLIQQMLQYIDDILGKGLSYIVLAELLFYFSLHIVPLALPLAVLLSSLITFGNLGEHAELTAMKSSGISMTRVLFPIFIFSLLVAIGSFWFNDQVVPFSNLRAYRLLWDIRQKSPTLNIKEGAFYDGLPGYRIKINEKLGDGKTIRDVMIYDHSKGRGNKELILADSGRMYNIMEDRYLVLELFRGKSYHDQMGANDGNASTERFMENDFDKSQIVFNLASFDLDTTDESLFRGHRIMKNMVELQDGIDSLQKEDRKARGMTFQNILMNYNYHLRDLDTNLKKEQTVRPRPNLKNKKKEEEKSKTLPVANQSKSEKMSDPLKIPDPPHRPIIQQAIKKAAAIKLDSTSRNRQPKVTKQRLINIPHPRGSIILQQASARSKNIFNVIKSRHQQLSAKQQQVREFRVEYHKKITLAFACITMFFIGAPLGAIIKKGGLGIPVLISVVFFIIFYVLSITGEKWVKEDLVITPVGMWMSNALLLVFGMFFLRQARNDSRLLEADFYFVLRDQITRRWAKKT